MSENKTNSKSIFESFGNLVTKAFSGSIESKIERLQKNENSGILFTKDKETGCLRWFGIYSSNYLDDDFPADIISADAHKGFIERVEKGVVPYPELWHAHVKGTKWGTTDWLAYDDETGVAYASGLVDEGHEKEALALAKYGKGRLGLSHGMDRDTFRRDDPSDSRVITQYNSYEISDLPLRWAANGMTALSFSETNKNNMEDGMAISESKKQYLTDAGLSEDQVEELEQLGTKQAELNSERPRKEKPAEEDTEQEDVTQKETEETTEKDDPAKESETADSDPGEENDAEKEGAVEPAVEALTRDEVIAVMSKGFEELGKVVAEALEKVDTRIAKIEDEQKARAEKDKEQLLAPTMSGVLEKIRAIGSQEAELKQGDPLLDDKPLEKEFDKEALKDGRQFVAKTLESLFN